jgi:DNA polymerase elongation subunit (family B)
MYQNIYIDKHNSVVHLWDDVGGYNTTKFQNYAYRKRDSGKYKSIYGDSLERITYFNPQDPSLFESDVPIETRLLIDLYSESDEPSIGHKIGIIDIETDIDGGYPDVDRGDKAITAISLYDYVSAKYIAFILDKDAIIKSNTINNRPNVDVLSFLTEGDLIQSFLNKWEQLGFTIVTGWNTSRFDFPYLYNRISAVFGASEAKRLSPIKKCYISKFNKNLVIAGISCLDYMELYVKYAEKKEPSYALDAIGRKQVNIGKISYTGSLNDLYKTDIDKYLEYNINDVVIVFELDKKFQFIELARTICHNGHVPYENFAMSSRYLEGAILTYLRRNGGLIAPNKPAGGKDEYDLRMEDDEEGFEGAYVKRPIPGRYDWIYDLDLTSMYPNIIISLNISPETKVGVVSRIEYDKSCIEERRQELLDNYDNLSDTMKTDISPEMYVNGKLHLFCMSLYAKGKITTFHVGSATYTSDGFKELITKYNLSVASNGVLYNKASNNNPGIIPSILIKWFDERKQMRKKAKAFADAKDWEKYEFYDQRQKVQKILLNSAYGVLGLPIFRFYDKDNASAVTLTGQDIIKTTGKVVNKYYEGVLGKPDDHVIYSDTDSCFVSAMPIIKHTMPDIDITDDGQMTAAILKVCTDVQTYVNQMFSVMALELFNLESHRFDAKQEVIAKTGFWLAKKRYTQLIINKGGVPISEMEVKGIDVVRTSFPLKFRSFMSSFLMDMLNKKDKSIIDDSIIDFKKGMDKLLITDIAKNTSVRFISKNLKSDYNPPTRSAFNFVNKTPAQVKAGLAYNDLVDLWKLDKKVQKIMHGQKIKWVYLCQNEYGIDCLAIKADGTDPKKILDFIELYVDRNAMYEKELKSKLQGFYTVLNWDFPDENMRHAAQFFDF